MKITKSQLKKLIREQLERIAEDTAVSTARELLNKAKEIENQINQKLEDKEIDAEYHALKKQHAEILQRPELQAFKKDK